MRAKIADPQNSELLSAIKTLHPNADLHEAIWLCWMGVKPKICVECSEKLKFKSLKDGYGGRFCSIKCASKHTYSAAQETKRKLGTDASFGTALFKAAMAKNHGVDNPGQSPVIMEKAKKTLRERHNVQNAFQLVKDRSSAQSDEVKSKRIKTNLIKYESTSPLGSSAVRARGSATLIENYGVVSPMHSEVVKLRMRSSRLESWRSSRIEALKYTVQLTSDITEITSKNSKLTWQCVNCKSQFSSDLDDGKTPRCYMCNPVSKTGHKLQSTFATLIGDHLGSVRHNDRTQIYPYELDFYWAKRNFAVELNGLYWHGELISGKRGAELRKHELAESKNIRLMSFFEDEIRDKPEQVKSIVLAACGQFDRRLQARKLKILELDSKTCSMFLNQNHIQGAAGGFARLGLITQSGELVAVMVIGKSRFNKGSNYELVRFCQLLNTQVMGGFGKLLAEVKRRCSGQIVSYVDRRIFNGVSYEKHGFIRAHVTKPGFYWTDYNVRMNRQKFQKHKLQNKNNDATSKAMVVNGIDKVWDCGQIVFKMEL